MGDLPHCQIRRTCLAVSCCNDLIKNCAKTDDTSSQTAWRFLLPLILGLAVFKLCDLKSLNMET